MSTQNTPKMDAAFMVSLYVLCLKKHDIRQNQRQSMGCVASEASAPNVFLKDLNLKFLKYLQLCFTQMIICVHVVSLKKSN